MSRPPRSLRTVLLVPVLVTVAAGFLAFSLWVDHGASVRRVAEIDGELARAAMVDLDADVGPPAGAPGPADPGVVEAKPPVHLRLAADGEVVAGRGADSPFSPATLAALAATDRASTVEVEDHRVRVVPEPDGQVLVTALSLVGYHAAMSALRRSLVVGGLVLVALEAAIVWLLAGRLVRPLRAMTGTVTRIADGALDTPVEPVGGSREVAQLSTDVGRTVQRLRSALDEREAAAAEADRARDDMRRFLADVSHEIRTPLTALQGYSDLYAQGMLAGPGAVDRAMARVGSESVRLHALVSSMMELARHGAGAARVVRDVDVAQVVRDVVEDLRAAHPGRCIDVGVDAGDTVVAGDPARLHQAVLNLGANACSHTAAGTRIAVEVGSTPAGLAVSVVDHGVGIDAAERERVFLPFYRSDPSRVRDGHGGAGLGLAVTRQIAHDHDGSVDVHPTPGGGATVTLRLRRTRPGAGPQQL